MMIETYATIVGYVMMATAGGLAAIALLGATYWAAGVLTPVVFKRMMRLYHLQSIRYWLDRLEREGTRCFLPPEKDGA